MQIDPSIKSRPKYQPPVLVDSAPLQVFICEPSALDQLMPLYAQCSPEQARLLLIGAADEAVSDIDPCTVEAMPERVQQLLAEVPVTTRLYVGGSEMFLWDIRNQALKAGLVDEQIQLAPPVHRARRLFCTHCYTVTEGVETSPCTCDGCGRLLLVRDHFSRVHGAYVGVQINAEDPDEQPEQEVLQ
ncbi:dimethylamine monooxygenase subunit DmmA family protein [Marinobacterium sp. MBR-109]|jgi:hypothetical protein|uniref:dimethylamine monooxygenase subunit DmmA family protein n=1 Tax=Marinobacterium sp. MBR-109 TaxID=3156462 RepID=UPI003390ADB8